VINTDRAQCRDCYRCVRNCHVKAVKVQAQQAEVVAERCIVCGRCVLECPQQAKRVRDDLVAVKSMIAAGRRVIASVAPSAPAFFHASSFAEIRVLLQRLGFADAAETAIGADVVGGEYRRILGSLPLDAPPLVATACPAVVALVEIYYPDLVPQLAPVVSPMIAHARILKAASEDEIRVVFIGPCIAKKREMTDDDVAGSVDAALSFVELAAWMGESGLAPSPRTMSDEGEPLTARLFPVEGGLLKTARLTTDVLATDVLAASGLDNCEEILDAIQAGEIHARIVELMTCQGGCVNGPRMPKGESTYARREWIIGFARQPEPSRCDTATAVDLTRGFADRGLRLPPIAEDIIRQVLARIEKYSPDDELNCSACGYNSCQAKAEATHRGMAEEGMCVPFMRSRAESLANVVMDVVPSAVVVVDNDLVIQEVSPSAELLLGEAKTALLGRALAEFAPVGTFKDVRGSGKSVLGRKTLYRDDLIVREFVVPVEHSNLIVGIIEDVTRDDQQQHELDRIRSATIRQAQEVIDKQIRVAHEIASLLGETTAETKVQLTRMIGVIGEGGGRQ
jgi:iron only hydrogenase large subunit-like protein/uncharacterized Fe-S cluster-containing protein